MIFKSNSKSQKGSMLDLREGKIGLGQVIIIIFETVSRIE